jgi:hypothetical protein
VTNKVFEFRGITLSYEQATAAGEATLYTDMPGNAMALRSTIALPVSTGGPAVKSEALDLEGTTYRVKLDPKTGAMKNITGKLSVRRIGLYLSGETYETGDLAVSI